MTVFFDEQEQSSRDSLDLFVFSLLSLFLPLFSIGSISFGQGGFAGFLIDRSQPLNFEIAIPLSIVFILLSLFLIYRRSPLIEKRKKLHIVYFLFAIFIVSRFFGIFLYPYENPSFTFSSEIYGSSATVEYVFSIRDRFLSLLQDCCFGIYFLLVFGYFQTFGKKASTAANVFLCGLVVLALAAFIYTCLSQPEVLSNNIQAALGKEGHYLKPLTSFTGHKNSYGFLLTLGCFSSLILFAKKPNPITPLLAVLFMLNCFLCLSRTATHLCFCALVLVLYLYPFFGFKTHSVYATICFVLAVLFSLVLAYIFTREEGSPLHRYITDLIRDMSDMGTVDSRKKHWDTAFTMMNSGFYQLFGYGRIPFYNLYRDYQIAIHAEMGVITSHNGLIEIFMHFGFIGVFLSVIVVLFLFYTILRQLPKSDLGLTLIYFFVFVLLLVHFYFEPRFFTLDEGSTILLLGAFVFPCLRDYQDHVLKEA